MMDIVLDCLRVYKRKKMKTDDMEHHVIDALGRQGYSRAGGYEVFAEIIVRLVDQKILRPIETWGLNGSTPSLYLGYEKLEPLYVVNRKAGSGESVNVLVVESLEAFLKLRTVFDLGRTVWDGTYFEVLTSIDVVEAGSPLVDWSGRGRRRELRLFYFGDLDPKGISRWYRLSQQKSLTLKPLVLFYQTLFDQYQQSAPYLFRKQTVNPNAVLAFLDEFPATARMDLLQFLRSGRYLSQGRLGETRYTQLSDDSALTKCIG